MPDPLPSSGTISISQISTFYEGGSENISLQGLAEAIGAGSPNIAMSLFYASACTGFECSGKSGEDPGGACELEPDTTFYHNGSGAYPQEGDTVFNDSSCSTTLNSGFYKMGNGNVIVIEGESGVVDSIESC